MTTATAVIDRRGAPNRRRFSDLQIVTESDPLTGLRCRRKGKELIEKLLISGEKGSLLILDLDQFRQINQIYSHGKGDLILKRFAEILKIYTRSEDVVCRYDGDRFLIFYRGFTDAELLSERCSRLIAKTEYIIREMLDDMHRSDFSVSIGTAIFPEDGMTFSELLANAGKALSRVKDRGGHRFCFYHESFSDSSDHCDEECFINISRLRGMVQESDRRSGAIKVDSDEFKKIFRFLIRFCERSGTKAQIVVLKMKNDRGTGSMVPETEYQLRTVIESSLRRGDVTSQYGRNQFLIILMDTDTENGKIAVKRLSKNWENLNQDYSIEYEIQNVIA